MNFKKVKFNGQLYGILVKKEFSNPGLTFFTPNEFGLQMGFLDYDKGKKLRSHIHIKNPRTIEKTQELIHVLSGKVKALLYDEHENYLKSLIVEEGDTFFHAKGGHGYEILEDGTRVLEIKNGPFISVEKDKKIINTK